MAMTVVSIVLRTGTIADLASGLETVSLKSVSTVECCVIWEIVCVIRITTIVLLQAWEKNLALLVWSELSGVGALSSITIHLRQDSPTTRLGANLGEQWSQSFNKAVAHFT